MSAADTLLPTQGRCTNPVTHRPAPLILDSHHVIPESWGGTNGAQEILCPSCHHSVHILIDLYVKLDRKPTRGEVTARFGCYGSTFLHALADQAWANHPTPPTYTS